MAIRFHNLSTQDVSGNDALACVDLIDRDNIDRDAGPVLPVFVRLNATERQAFKDVIDRAKAKYQARIDAAIAKKAIDPTAPINLRAPLEGEAP